jgi:hypothetical protein
MAGSKPINGVTPELVKIEVPEAVKSAEMNLARDSHKKLEKERTKAKIGAAVG